MSVKTRKENHVVLRNGAFFCMNCGRSYTPPSPIEVYMWAAMSEAFTKEHKNCPKTWQEPVADPALPERERIMFWREHGERGVSSETIWTKLSGFPLRHWQEWGHPHDPADFYRCHKLLEVVPEWRSRLDEMRSISDVWNKLVDHWDELTEMLMDNLSKKKPNGMYERMKELGC